MARPISNPDNSHKRELYRQGKLKEFKAVQQHNEIKRLIVDSKNEQLKSIDEFKKDVKGVLIEIKEFFVKQHKKEEK